MGCLGVSPGTGAIASGAPVGSRVIFLLVRRSNDPLDPSISSRPELCDFETKRRKTCISGVGGSVPYPKVQGRLGACYRSMPKQTRARPYRGRRAARRGLTNFWKYISSVGCTNSCVFVPPLRAKSTISTFYTTRHTRIDAAARLPRRDGAVRAPR